MFTLTRKTDYALIALTHMAQQKPGVLCTSKDISGKYRLPPALLVNVLKSLVQGEVVRSMRGTKGGYALAMPADRITLAAVIQAIEGPIRFVQCAGLSLTGEANCELIDSCPLTRPVRKVHSRLMDFLNEVTLAEIAFGHEYEEPHIRLSREGAALKMESSR
jgi:Rrf2 family protein